MKKKLIILCTTLIALVLEILPYGAVFDETDFIEYLNTVLYPHKPSKKLKTIPADDEWDVPEEYRKYPYYNF